MKNIRKRNIIVVLIIWVGIMFALSSQDGSATSRTSILLVNKIMDITGVTPTATTFTKIHIIIRKAAHVVLYLTFGILAMTMGYIFLEKRENSKNEALVFLVVCIVSIADEWHKQFIPGRHNDYKDILLNIAAGLVGIMITYFIKQKKIKWLED